MWMALKSTIMRSTLIPPVVDPAQPQMRLTRMSMKQGSMGHEALSLMAKPVVDA